MRIVPVCMLVCVCLLGIFQLTEAICGTPKPVCADDSENGSTVQIILSLSFTENEVNQLEGQLLTTTKTGAVTIIKRTEAIHIAKNNEINDLAIRFANEVQCTGKTSCLTKSPDEPLKCYPCPCKDNGHCIMVNKKLKCICNPGFTGDNCECPFFQDCSPSDTTQYRGTQNQVPSGWTCQRWDSQSPHSHGATASSMFPMDGSVTAAQNYCRDPGGAGYLWCFIMDPDERWEKCNIPTC